VKPDGRYERIEGSAENAGRDGELERGEERREAHGRKNSPRETGEHRGAERRDAEEGKAAGGSDEEGIAGGMRAAGAQVRAEPHGSNEEHLVPFPGVGRERQGTDRNKQDPRGRRECEGREVPTALHAGGV